MAKRYFEFVEGTSSKFWEIWREGTEVRTRYGRIGANGQITVKDPGSDAAATKLFDSLVAEKTKKGYQEKTPGAAPAASSAAAPPKPAPPNPAENPAWDALVARIEKKAKAAGVTLEKGAKETAIAAAEKALGQVLPEEVKAFYRRHDASEDDCGPLGRELLSLERMVAEWKIWKDLLDKGTFEDNDHSSPGPGVQQRWWIPEWIPITYDGAGNHHVLDLAPAKGGAVGQIVDFYHDEETRKVVGKSFLQWLADVAWGEDDDDEDEDEDEDENAADAGGFRRFEMEEKFWAIKLEGSSHTVRFGKLGTKGQEKTKDFSSEEAAKKDYEKLVAEKTKKGYEEV